LSVSAQNLFKANDLEGKWQSTKPGAELFIEINGETAIITSVEKTKLTTNIVGGAFYEAITYEGNGVWNAQRNAWMYSGTDSSKGHWEKSNKLKLTLSQDRNTLTASGHWTYKRVNKVISTPSVKVEPVTTKSTNQESSTKNQKQVILEDFDGVKGKFTLITSDSNGGAVIAQFNNYTKDKTATVIVKLNNGNISFQRIGPGAGFTANYTAKTIEVQVLYQSENETEPFDLIDFVKDKVRKKITVRDGLIENPGSIGARG
jgi:hypothetical protein